ncbi:MAG: aldo/keto reductase [Chloroflexota bacterium]
MLEQRRLGRTGHMSSVVTFGAAALGRVDQATADAAVELALEAGVNQFDVAPSYGDAELRLGPWMGRIRNDIFLNCKTNKRTRAEAAEELHRSLDRLRTDHLDLYQLHSVGKRADMEACLGTGGALEALVEAREQGLTRYLGITGHTHDAPSTMAEALRRFDFDTVMFPLNFVLWSLPDFRRDAQGLLDLCAERDMGVHIIKTAARGPWGDQPQNHSTWYQPFDDQAHVNRAVAFNLSRPGITTLCSSGDVDILRLFIRAAEQATPLSPAAEQDILAQAGSYSTPFVGAMA